GQALGFAAGAYLAAKKIPAVFLQNSGFGNLINPLTSLNQLYEIPAFLIMTWRGEGGKGHDAPEHDIMGERMESYLKAFDIPYEILDEANYKKQIKKIVSIATETKKPAGVVIREGVFEDYPLKKKFAEISLITRYEAIQLIKDTLTDYHFLSTTGYISRESFALKDSPDFYMMGSMGMIAAIGAGVATHTNKSIVLLDGDGAILMHMGLIPFIGHLRPRNLLHIVLDNEAYASTKNQPTISGSVQLHKVAKHCGYANVFKVSDLSELNDILQEVQRKNGPSFVLVKVKKGNKHGVPRVSDKYTCDQVTHRFMHSLAQD
ncbi:MAG: thiamine pyrophosphate-dependent enzyme, partial [bacterium]